MSAIQASNPFDLLGQANTAPPPVHLPGRLEPQLEISWGAFRQSLSSSLSGAFERSAESRKFLSKSFFKDAWVEKRFPRRAVAAAALWHLVFLVMPKPDISAPVHNAAFDNTILTWSGPVEDLPLLEVRGKKPKPTPRGEPDKPAPQTGADAFHPRQRIFTDPARPTHPRQTLINPQAPPDAPKLLPAMPNIVQLAPVAAPVRPRIEISERILKSLRPREHKARTIDTNAPAPDVLNNEVHPADLTIAATQNAPARPKLEINAGAAPRLATQKRDGEFALAPEMAASASNGAASTLIALSATPGPPVPVAPPEGNLAARIAIGPEGKQRGAPGGTANPSAASNGGAGGGPGKNDVGVSISGGHPSGTVSGSGGAKPKLDLSAANSNAARAARNAPPNFADLAPGAKPEAIFASKKVYTLHVNMPNLNSATGSWILSFSELSGDAGGRRVAIADDVASPQPLRKVDPKYPPTLIAEHVEGEVVLYAVIRKDGSVDSIQLVRGIDEQLDANAMHAFAQWKFQPAEKHGEAIDLEAIVHIPFRAPARQ
jgi:TonB family protein